MSTDVSPPVWGFNEYVHGSEWVNASVQRLFGVSSKRHRAPLLIHWIFEFGSFLGNELFYLIFLSANIWACSPCLGGRLMIGWAVCMYLGQAAKDILCWPRPSPLHNLRILEKHYAGEYGFPSTHTACAILLPWLMTLTALPLIPPTTSQVPLFAMAIGWTIVTPLSRIYLGVHYLADLIGGLIAGLLSLWWSLEYLPAIWAAALSSPIHALVTVPFITSALLLIHPDGPGGAGLLNTATCFGASLGATVGAGLIAWVDSYILSSVSLTTTITATAGDLAGATNGHSSYTYTPLTPVARVVTAIVGALYPPASYPSAHVATLQTVHHLNASATAAALANAAHGHAHHATSPGTAAATALLAALHPSVAAAAPSAAAVIPSLSTFPYANVDALCTVPMGPPNGYAVLQSFPWWTVGVVALVLVRVVGKAVGPLTVQPLARLCSNIVFDLWPFGSTTIEEVVTKGKARAASVAPPGGAAGAARTAVNGSHRTAIAATSPAAAASVHEHVDVIRRRVVVRKGSKEWNALRASRAAHWAACFQKLLTYSMVGFTSVLFVPMMLRRTGGGATDVQMI